MAQEQLQFSPAVLDNKIKGTILGSALGDTVGLYTEFLSKEASIKAYPARKFQLVDPVTEFLNDGHRNKFEKNSWTDDTDHSLLILLSYLHHDGTLHPEDLATRLRSWVEQGLRCLDRLPLGLGNTVGRVVLNPSFLTSPSSTAYKSWNAGGRNMAPNGSLMRTHPLGVITATNPSLTSAFEIAAKYSIITHADPRCVVSCCVVTGLIRGILRREVVEEEDVGIIINEAFDWVNVWLKSGRKFSDEAGNVETGEGEGETEEQGEEDQEESPLNYTEFLQHTFAETFKELKLDEHQKIGYAYKALGSSILCLRLGMRKAPRGMRYAYPTLFENIITELIMEGGDADTNACTAGALLGCWVGYDLLPPNWRDGMKHREWLLGKCDGMMETMGVKDGNGYKGSEDPDTRPDGGKGFLTRPELEAREKEFMVRYMRMYEEKLEREKKANQGWFSKMMGR